MAKSRSLRDLIGQQREESQPAQGGGLPPLQRQREGGASIGEVIDLAKRAKSFFAAKNVATPDLASQARPVFGKAGGAALGAKAAPTIGAPAKGISAAPAAAEGLSAAAKGAGVVSKAAPALGAIGTIIKLGVSGAAKAKRRRGSLMS